MIAFVISILTMFIISSCKHEEKTIIKKQQRDYIEYKKQIENDFNEFLIKSYFIKKEENRR